jgi:hypothetical protein
MPRANRHYTHRRRHKGFLLKFARDRRRCLHWLFEAKKRFGLAVRDARWWEAIAVSNLAFAEKVKGKFGIKAMHRAVAQAGETYALREASEAYGCRSRAEIRRANVMEWVGRAT